MDKEAVALAPYASDTASADFLLFLKLKECRFHSRNEIQNLPIDNHIFENTNSLSFISFIRKEGLISPQKSMHLELRMCNHFVFTQKPQEVVAGYR